MAEQERIMVGMLIDGKIIEAGVTLDVINP